MAPARSTEPPPGTLDLVFSTLALAALALAQPVLDLLGRSPEFFVARASPALDVVLVPVVLGVGVPLLLAGVVALVHAVNQPAGRVLHRVLLTLFGGLIVVTLLEHTPAGGLSGWVLLGLGVAAGVALSWGYYRSRSLRSVFRFLAVAPVVVTAVFLLVAPTSELAWASASPQETVHAPVGDPAPVVMIVFDEFPVASLLDGEGNIQAEHFPNFARLAADGTWFRNAVGVHQQTEKAIPTILTGVSAPMSGKVPRAKDYPNNIFTLLGAGYRVQAVETLTELCPEFVCAGGSREQVRTDLRWTSLGMDLAVVSGHVLLPDDLTTSLPAIDQGWGNFGVGDATGPVPEWDNPERFFANVGADRRNDVARVLDGIDHPLANNEFHFAHLLLPHRPWSYLPDGREYLATDLTGRGPGGWGADAWLVEQSYQRLQIQVQYLDRLLGDLIDRLESHDSYDDTLIVIVADHGISVRPEQPRRSITPETIGDIAAVPLFIKRPHQDSGGVDDYRAETTDVVPTIADVLGIDLPWRADGVSLFSEVRPPRTQSTMMSGHPVTFGVDGSEKQTIADYHLEYFGDRGPFGLAPIGQADLLGTELASLDFDDDPESQLLLDLPEGYLATDPGADPLPAQISGRVSGAGDGYLTLAIVLNGRIEAVTRSGAFGDSERFVAMLPPDALRAENHVEVLVVQGSGANRTLTRPTGS